MTHWLKQALGVAYPIIQAPMAGVSSPAMAAAVCEAGGLGSLGVGAMNVDGARAAIRDTRALTARAFNINLFCHAPARRDAKREAAWLAAMAPEFARFNATPPDSLSEIYQSFITSPDMLPMLMEEAPAVVSFHFGLPEASVIEALKTAGITLMASATSRAEARACRDAGVHAIVAQGIEAGGHRGLFDPEGADEHLSTRDLLQELVSDDGLPPVIAAGGLMNGQDIRDVLQLGAVAAQLGTAFVACNESLADAAYRAALGTAGAQPTVLTDAISGRPARCLNNRFVAWARTVQARVPDYPVAYDAGKALNAAAKAAGEHGFGAQWAGTGAASARSGPAAEIMARLVAEAGLT